MKKNGIFSFTGGIAPIKPDGKDVGNAALICHNLQIFHERLSLKALKYFLWQDQAIFEFHVFSTKGRRNVFAKEASLISI